MERPAPFPTQSYATPKQNPKPRLSIETKSRPSAAGVSPVFEGVPPLVTDKLRDIPPALAVHAARPSVSTAQVPLPSRATVAFGSPTTPSGQYVAMLDFGKAFHTPKPADSAPVRQSMPAAPKSKPPAVNFSIPVTRTTETNSPTRYRRTSLATAKADGEVSPGGPVGSSIKLPTKASPDPSYRGGYESDENSPHRGRTASPAYLTPNPSVSPKSRPTLPRISTDLSPIAPLNIQPVHVPEQLPNQKTKVRSADEGLTSADAQSSDLTNILDSYLDEIISDAKARGVMSAGLEEYLKSPTIMGEWKNDLQIIYEDKPVGNGDVVRTVSIVRRALHSD